MFNSENYQTSSFSTAVLCAFNKSILLQFYLQPFWQVIQGNNNKGKGVVGEVLETVSFPIFFFDLKQFIDNLFSCIYIFLPSAVFFFCEFNVKLIYFWAHPNCWFSLYIKKNIFLHVLVVCCVECLCMRTDIML